MMDQYLTTPDTRIDIGTTPIEPGAIQPDIARPEPTPAEALEAFRDRLDEIYQTSVLQQRGPRIWPWVVLGLAVGLLLKR
jgi:hypothetical protein